MTWQCKKTERAGKRDFNCLGCTMTNFLNRGVLDIKTAKRKFLGYFKLVEWVKE
jgi:hypothetical protein